MSGMYPCERSAKLGLCPVRDIYLKELTAELSHCHSSLGTMVIGFLLMQYIFFLVKFFNHGNVAPKKHRKFTKKTRILKINFEAKKDLVQF